jgi:3'(2'), 5'-bisphosphate nucleotidase
MPESAAARLADLLPGVLDAVAAASTAILEVYATCHDVEYKADESPLTRADRAAHEILARRLAAIAPAIPMLSEEAETNHARAARGEWREFWLVDPLDGTKEFISRNGEFTVNVALIRDHRPVLGVVAAPALGLTYYAAEGAGAFRREAGGAVEAIHVRRAADPLVVVGSRSHRGDSLDAVLARLGAHELRPMGSALKFCLVAEGSADFYPRLGPTSEWDTAAAQCVVETAGGAVIGLDGRPLVYNKPDILNPFFLVTGGGQYDWRAFLDNAA